MNSERALDEQIKRYRQMTGKQRLAIALELHELSCNESREGIRHQNPDADEAEVERLLLRRLESANSEKQGSEIATARMPTRGCSVNLSTASAFPPLSPFASEPAPEIVPRLLPSPVEAPWGGGL